MRAVGALLALSMSTFVYVTAELLPIGLLVLIADDLGASKSAVGLLVTGYGLVVILTAIPLTRLASRVPRRYLLCGLLSVFVVANLGSAAAPTYGLLLVARLVTALSQALFWSLAAPAAVGLFSPRVRARALAVLFGGASSAAVLGVPAGTWIGEVVDWRVAFVALSGLGLVALVTITALLPTTAPGQSHADRGAAPDARRYWTLMVMTALAITGAFTSFTYITPFLTEVSAFTVGTISSLLLVRGVAGVIGSVMSGLVADRRPWLTMVLAIALQTVSLLGLYAAGADQVAAVVMMALAGLSIGILATVLNSRVLHFAPGSSDMAAAGTSTAFNIGITAGAFIGSVLLPASGVRSTALVGGLLSIAALAVVLGESRLAAIGRGRHPYVNPARELGPLK